MIKITTKQRFERYSGGYQWMNFEDCKFTEALRSCLGKIANPTRL